MRWNTHKKCPVEELYVCNDEECCKELQRKELALMQKEKELYKKDKILQRKITKFDKRKKNKAKNDLRAASKLRDARKKLLLTLDGKEKVQKCDKHTCKKSYKTHVPNTNTKHRKKRVETVKRETCSPVQYFKGLLNRPCECSTKKNRSTIEPESYLRKILGGPTDFLANACNYFSKNSERDSNCPCRCPQRTRESYWDRAAGDCYLMSMRRPPQLWLYNRFPRFYPQYLGARQQCKNCKHILLIIAAILFWTPCLLCLELCKCCFCACCTE